MTINARGGGIMYPSKIKSLISYTLQPLSTSKNCDIFGVPFSGMILF